MDTKDRINSPAHYTQGSIEPLTYIVANQLDYREGNIVKYVTRWPYKGATDLEKLEDLYKGRVYLDHLIEEFEGVISGGTKDV
jgi:hypothetical protein